jgi:hypothetical protein
MTLLLACSGGGKKDKEGSDGGSTSELAAGGFCADTCPKECQGDTECDTADGELCCNFGDNGQICMPAAMCPRFCDDDVQCDTDVGEACVRPTLAIKEKVCAQPKVSVRTCSDENGCDTGNGETCCDIYNEAICLPAYLCPKACSSSNECDTQGGQVCCKTLSQADPTLRSVGLCVDPDRVPCPKICSASGDCDTGQGELCCNGFCSTSCAKKCETSNECSGQICCKALASKSPLFSDGLKSAGYEACTCSGIETACGDTGTLHTCDGCTWQVEDCNSKCTGQGYASGMCDDYGYSGYTAECVCSSAPPDPVDPGPSNPLAGFGDICDQTNPCDPGLQCVVFDTGSTTGMCTKTCATIGDLCSGGPSGSYALCAFEAGGQNICGFICELSGQTYSCPSYQYSCEVVDPAQPSIKVCLVK